MTLLSDAAKQTRGPHPDLNPDLAILGAMRDFFMSLWDSAGIVGTQMDDPPASAGG